MSAVAEQHAGRAVLPIEDTAERFRADNDGGPAGPSADHRVRDAEGIEKARAHGVHVERDAIVDSERRLHLGGR